MHTSLYTLPQPLLNHLGACSRLDSIAGIRQINMQLSFLRQHNSGEPYHVSNDSQGLTLTLQCINPSALPEEHHWGLHGITLDAAIWDGGWPTGLSPQKATAEDVAALFGPNPEEVVRMHPMLCFAIEGLAGQTLSVIALFEAAGKTLSSFSLLRTGEWRVLEPVVA